MSITKQTLSCFILALGACAPKEGAEFELLRFVQSGRKDIRLNEILVFQFSAPVDIFTVNSENALIQSETGEQAHGQFQLAGSGKELRFIPDPVLQPKLMDGGLRPNALYEVHILSFPSLRSLRSADGNYLGKPSRFRFQTIDPDNLPPGAATAFEDRQPKPLSFQTPTELRADEPLLLHANKPLLPDTVSAATIQLVEETPGKEKKDLPVRVQLLSNGEEATIGIFPGFELQKGKNYILKIGEGIRDFSGKGFQFSPRFGSDSYPLCFSISSGE